MHQDCSRKENEEEVGAAEEKLDEARTSRRRKQKGLSASAPRVDIKGHCFQVFEKHRQIQYKLSPSAHMLARVTKGLVDLYRSCNSQFSFSPDRIPRKVLTEPNTKAGNGGADNEQSNLIISVNDVLVNDPGGRSYRVSAMLGEGTFGQVVKCEDSKTKKWVAVKVIKNNPAYHNQAVVELGLLQMLNAADKDDTGHIVRLIDNFAHKNHLCLVFEMLGMNLYEFIKANSFRGMSCSLVKAITKQMLEAMVILRDTNVIHCDLKPENVLFVRSGTSAIKLIDFGSACMDMQTIYSYVQSRFYRSPEVLLGLPYDASIDMWSLGCIIAELFIGLPVFPGQTQHNQVARIVKLLGLPDARMLDRATPNIRKFFNAPHDPLPIDEDGSGKGKKCEVYSLKSAKQFARETNTEEVQSKKYFNGEKLDDILLQYPFKRSLDSEGRATELKTRESLLHFLKGLLRWEPHLRWTPKQALDHPFITGAPLDTFQEIEDPPVEMWAGHSAQYVQEFEHHLQVGSAVPYVGSYADDPLRPRVSEVHHHYQQHHAHFRDGIFPGSYSPPSRCSSGQTSPHYYDLGDSSASHSGRYRGDYKHWDEGYYMQEGRLSRGSTDSLQGGRAYSESRHSYSENQRYSETMGYQGRASETGRLSEAELSPMRGRTSTTRAFLRVPGLGVDTSPVQNRSSRSSSDDASLLPQGNRAPPPPRVGKSKSLNEGKSYLSPFATSFEQLTVSPQLTATTPRGTQQQQQQQHREQSMSQPNTPSFRILPPLHAPAGAGYMSVNPRTNPLYPVQLTPSHSSHHNGHHNSPPGRPLHTTRSYPSSHNSPSPSRPIQHAHTLSPSRSYPPPPPSRPYSNQSQSSVSPPGHHQQPHQPSLPPLILNPPPPSNTTTINTTPRGRPRPAGSPER